MVLRRVLARLPRNGKAVEGIVSQFKRRRLWMLILTCKFVKLNFSHQGGLLRIGLAEANSLTTIDERLF